MKIPEFMQSTLTGVSVYHYPVIVEKRKALHPGVPLAEMIQQAIGDEILLTPPKTAGRARNTLEPAAHGTRVD